MRRETAELIIQMYASEIKDAPCSKGHHLSERGGLLKHLCNVEYEATMLDPRNETLIALARIHDIGKARTYKISKHLVAMVEEDKIEYTEPAVDHLINTIAMIEGAVKLTGYHLTQEELHALQYHHGGFSPFAVANKSGQVALTELAIKLHYCDILASLKEVEGRYFDENKIL